MATAYVGYRPVLKGRSSSGNVNFYRANAVGTYSNWSLFNTSHVLDGAPDTARAMGFETDVRKIRLLEYMYVGKPHLYPMRNAGGGTRLDYHRTKPFEYKGLTGAKVFESTFGHAKRDLYYGNYNNFVYDGLVSAEAMKAPGHASHSYDYSYGGNFDPNLHQGVTKAMSGTVGKAAPVDNQNEYGLNKVLEWTGVPASRAL